MSPTKHPWPLVEKLYTLGLKSRTIGERLNISVSVVENYVYKNGLLELREMVLQDRMEEVIAAYEEARP